MQQPMTTSIPVIDIKGLYSDDIEDRMAVATEIGNAVDGLGFFYVKNHLVSEQTICGIREVTAEFFALSHEEKMKYYVGKSTAHKGYLPEGEEDFGMSTAVDHKEALTLGMELDESHPAVQKSVPFYGHNVWPEEIPNFRKQVLEYYDGVYDLAKHLMHAFALMLGLEENALDPYFDDPIAPLRLIHYPDTPGADGSIGISEHEDFECITILLSDAPGLELKLENGEWLDAPPIPGTFIVNIGQMLQIISNGRVKPRTHRVRPVSQDRLSFPFFMAGNYSAEMKPLPQLEGKGPYDTAYSGVKVGDHMWSSVMQTYRYLIDRLKRGEVEIPQGTIVRRRLSQSAMETPELGLVN